MPRCGDRTQRTKDLQQRWSPNKVGTRGPTLRRGGGGGAARQGGAAAGKPSFPAAEVTGGRGAGDALSHAFPALGGLKMAAAAAAAFGARSRGRRREKQNL